MVQDESKEKPLAVQLAEAGVEDPTAIAAAVEAEGKDSGSALNEFLSGTDPQQVFSMVGSLLQQNQPQRPREPPREPRRATTDGGTPERSEPKGSPLRREHAGRAEADEEAEADEKEADDES